MHPSSLLSYYPTYAILDEVVSYGGYKTLNIFMDLKNTLQSTYMEHAIVNIVESSKKSAKIDTSIFSSLISFLSFHKMYGVKRGINTNFIIFFESGHSYYHKNISKQYKISRRIDDLYGLDKVDRDLFFETLQANFQLIEKACNLMPNIKVVRLPNLEADFVPYYVTTRNLVQKGDGVGNLIYSNDHDLWQCLNDHVFIFSKSGKTKKILKCGNVMELFLKKKNQIPDSFLPLAMAIIGDPGDDVMGVNGIGPASFLSIFDQLTSMTGNSEQIYERVDGNKDLFNFIPPSISNKKLSTIVDSEVQNKTISKNLRLVSFELISRAIDNPSTTEMRDKRLIIEKQFQPREFVPVEKMKDALIRNGVFLEESSIDFLYI
jgi:5'-3' exonuclease, N-terminal resolvase-like domain